MVHGAPKGRKLSWITSRMAEPEGAWPVGPLRATCKFPHPEESDKDKVVPGEDCTCGYYATTELETVYGYFADGAPVVGLLALRGRVIDAEKGIRGEYAKIAAIFLLDPVLPSLPHDELRRLAAKYKIPALVPYSLDPDDYRAAPKTGRGHPRPESAETITDADIEQFRKWAEGK